MSNRFRAVFGRKAVECSVHTRTSNIWKKKKRRTEPEAEITNRNKASPCFAYSNANEVHFFSFPYFNISLLHFVVFYIRFVNETTTLLVLGIFRA